MIIFFSAEIIIVIFILIVCAVGGMGVGVVDTLQNVWQMLDSNYYIIIAAAIIHFILNIVSHLKTSYVDVFKTHSKLVFRIIYNITYSIALIMFTRNMIDLVNEHSVVVAFSTISAVATLFLPMLINIYISIYSLCKNEDFNTMPIDILFTISSLFLIRICFAESSGGMAVAYVIVAIILALILNIFFTILD